MPLLANKKYVLCLIDNKEYCLVNGSFDKFLKSRGLTRPQYVEQYELVKCRCKYCGAQAQIKSGLTPVDTCGSNECAKKARATAISNTDPEVRKQWNAVQAERRRTDNVYAAKINAAAHAGNLVVGEDGLTGYERTAKKRQETLLKKYGNAFWANAEKTKQTWANKSDEEKNEYARLSSQRQKNIPTTKRKEINNKIVASHLEKYGMACPANKKVQCGASQIAGRLFEALDTKSAKFKPKCREEAVGRFLVDYFDNGKVIEFYGDYWHANPQKFKPEDLVGRGQWPAKEIWARDAARVAKIKAAGYQVKIIWERDFKRNPERVILECKEWLNNS